MTPLPADKGLKIFDIQFKIKTAGPSPYNNERTEVFLLGCKKAANGNPCPGCFNPITWDSSKAEHSWDPIAAANKIAEMTSNRYITIGGGEPTDQVEFLVPFVKQLKEQGFHIIMYTYRTVWFEKKSNKTIWFYTDYPYKLRYFSELFKYVDIIIDGEYQQENRSYIDKHGDGLFGSIGSSNQSIIDVNRCLKFDISMLEKIELDKNNELKYILRKEE